MYMKRPLLRPQIVLRNSSSHLVEYACVGSSVCGKSASVGHEMAILISACLDKDIDAIHKHWTHSVVCTVGNLFAKSDIAIGMEYTR